jgi:ribosomal protein L11 methyltransferase
MRKVYAIIDSAEPLSTKRVDWRRKLNYTKVKVYVGADDIDKVAAFLYGAGISSVEIEDPQTYHDFLEKKNSFDWDYYDKSLERLKESQANIDFYIEDTIDGIELLDNILDEIREYPIESIEISGVSDEDWKHKWKEYFKPARISKKFVVKPSWEEYEKIEGDLVINIDPGMAFGTGTHPTTSLCIKLMEEYLDENHETVLDIGCGSGVLTIAAALLGAKKILAVDIDDDAIAVSKANVKNNGLAAEITIKKGDLIKGVDGKWNIAVANLMVDLIVILTGEIKERLEDGGIFISSGILYEKRYLAESALKNGGFEILKILEDGEWCAIAATIAKERH